MKKFNLERALAGDKVVTRNGQKVNKIVNFDGIGKNKKSIAFVLNGNVFTCKKDGRFKIGNIDSGHDLFMAQVKRQGWINIFKCGSESMPISGRVYCSEDEALESGHGDSSRIDTVMIEWEE